MKNSPLACLALSVACIVGCEQPPDPAPPGAVELAPAAADAVAVQTVVQSITKLGANVGRDAAGRIVAVNLMFCPATDDDLKAISRLADLQD